jgi:DNA-binding Lrp family transcriptional regulator
LRKRLQSSKKDIKNTKNTKLYDLTLTDRRGTRNTDKLDKTDILILSDLLKNADIKSKEISNKLKIPLSTIQRRRTRIDHSSMLKKGYEIDYKQFGLRRADLMINVSKGDCVIIAQEIVKEYKENVLEASITIGDPQTNLVVEVVYSDSNELFNMILDIKRMEHVEDVRWSEIIKAIIKNDSEIAAKLLSNLVKS